MRRKDREITDFQEICRIVAACEVIRIGLTDPDDPGFPYIVPMNFGYAVQDETLTFFIHGARAGRKFELLQRMGCCSFEMDAPSEIVLLDGSHEVTTRYRSVMGRATAALLEGEALLQGLEALMARREDTRTYPWSRASVPHTAVWQLTVTQLSAKGNPARA